MLCVPFLSLTLPNIKIAMLFSPNNRLLKAQVTAVALICLSNLIVFIALLTPAWQVAKDTDAGVYVQSGLWLYCPGSVQCWYIFSDDVVNYYERVDVCRFFLIGDCRKKLLRTPYFFASQCLRQYDLHLAVPDAMMGNKDKQMVPTHPHKEAAVKVNDLSWHYAVLIIIIFALIFGVTATAALGVSIFKKNKARILTIVFNGFAFLSFLFLAIALAVFVINAEMLESRYLIGIKNTFRVCTVSKIRARKQKADSHGVKRLQVCTVSKIRARRQKADSHGVKRLQIVADPEKSVVDFQKEYGYSFYLAALAMLLLLFALLAGVMVATFVFFSKGAHDHSAVPGTEEDDLWQRNQLYALRKIKASECLTSDFLEAELQSSLMSSSTAIPVFEQQVFEQPPRPGSIGGSHSDTPLPPPDVLHSRGGCPNY
uniref:Uncharacterized protein n=1 Tax=Ascaris lumbricoides TaxID=6252 RepID=A0A9J2Q210_ASCLU